MITFGVRFYNATTDEWITNDYRQVSIALYSGTRLLETEQSDVESLLPGEINDFYIDRGTNISRLLKGMYDVIIDAGGVANTEVRACLTYDTDHNYIAYAGLGILIFADHNGTRQQWQAFFGVDGDPPFFFTNANSIHDIFPLYYDRPVIFGCVITSETQVMLLPRDYLLTAYPKIDSQYVENIMVSRCISNTEQAYTKYTNLSLPSNRTELIPFTHEITSPITDAKYTEYTIVSMWAAAFSNVTAYVTERFDSGRRYEYTFDCSIVEFDYEDPNTGWEGPLYYINFADSNDSMRHDAVLISKIPTDSPTAVNITEFMRGVTVITTRNPIYYTLNVYDEGGSDVDPDNPPDPYDPPIPQTPDNPDPYIDPRDPEDPEDPGDPDKQPTEPGGGDPPERSDPDPVTPPAQPPSHAIDSHFVTLYTPSLSQLNNLAQYLWSNGWSVESFKKILANPMDCILGLMIFPALSAPTGTKNIYVGNLDTGISMSYVTNQYVDVNCGSFEIKELYASYLDYAPYTKIDLYLPYIGMQSLSADDVMGKTVQLLYRIDLLSSACVAFVIVGNTTLYTFTGSCGTSIPVSGTDWSNMLNGIINVAGVVGTAVVTGGASLSIGGGLAAASSMAVSALKPQIRRGGSVASAAGLMSIQTPYLIITRPRMAVSENQNAYQGYPSYITQSLGSCVGYTEVEEVHLEHIPATDEEIREIETLLKGGVLF